MPEIENNIPEKFWHILYTNPRSEKKMGALLKKYHIENYVPVRKERKKWSDRFKWSEFPVFPSYVFVKIEFWNEKTKVLQLPGAHHFIFDKGNPGVVSEEILEDLRKGLESYNDTIQVVPDHVLEKGKMIRVIDGAYKGKTMEIIKRKNKAMVILRFEAMKIATSLEIPLEFLAWEELL
ncbi:UpxY family transcription antiterminator [Leptospira sp. 96542]|nr:UpxY family transcription antiterminator [Leptospira sp. 96542]